jgi:hypothetical protein
MDASVWVGYFPLLLENFVTSIVFKTKWKAGHVVIPTLRKQSRRNAS